LSARSPQTSSRGSSQGGARARALAIGCAVGGAAAACSAILDLKAPPAPIDSGVTGLPLEDDSGDAAGETDAGADSATPPVVCAPLAATAADAAATTYSSFDLPANDGGLFPWEAFDTSLLARHGAYTGATFDGRYVYFAGRTTLVTRFDTTLTFEDATSWSQYDLASLGVPGGFAGAVFDNRYVYFVPYLVDTTTHPSVVSRFDTTGSFSSAASWASFDTSTLPVDGGSVPGGFFGAGFDGRYVYFVPRNDGTPDGRIVRYDTTPLDGGSTAATDAGSADGGNADAGDAAAAANAAFGDLALWATFDLSTINPGAIGFAGAVFDGTSLYLVPAVNDVLDASVHSGTSGIVARLKTASSFAASSSWTTFDLTTVNGLAENFLGGAFDGRYVYFAPRGAGIVPRLDTRAAVFNATAAWSTYDLTQLFQADAATPQYAGAAFDGRFVYLVPIGTSFYGLTRYDTLSTFTADCAWSTFDVSRVPMTDAGPPSYVGAVFDGQYLYLVPDGEFSILRFDTKSPAAMPALPAFHGSFL